MYSHIIANPIAISIKLETKHYICTEELTVKGIYLLTFSFQGYLHATSIPKFEVLIGLQPPLPSVIFHLEECRHYYSYEVQIINKVVM